jgi:PilZ domain
MVSRTSSTATAFVAALQRVLLNSGVTMAAMLGRAQRFEVQLLIRFKKIGGRRWFEGKTENISRSGILFRADRLLKVRTAIQMSFTLPVWGKGDGPGEVVCQGSVVRTVAAVRTNRPCVAASIQRYRIRPQARKKLALHGGMEG